MNYYKIEDEYVSKSDKIKYWNLAIGLQDVDNLKPSKYLLDVKQKNIEGELKNEDIEKLLIDKNDLEHIECDVVSNRIVKLLSINGFSFNLESLKSIHLFLFHGLYNHAGSFRNLNIYKEEDVLNGETVKYENYFNIENTLKYDFENFKSKELVKKNQKEIIKLISEFTSSIWQVHPFFEGNTRTTAVFIQRYLNYCGFCINNDLFKEKSLYFRNSLVLDNYSNYSNNIFPNRNYLELFFEKLLFNQQLELQKIKNI